MNHLMKVVHTQRLTPDTLELHLQPQFPFAYEAGDYLKLGRHQDDLKPFSIANGPQKSGLIEVHIKDHDHSEFMKGLFALSPGDCVLVEGPHHQYRLPAPACQGQAPFILVAGGTGFSPMKALLDELLAQQCQAPIYFYWGARHEDDLYHRARMIALAEQHDNVHYREVLSAEETASVPRTGMVHKAVLEDFGVLDKARVYVCGPWPMIQAAKDDFEQAGLPESNFN